MIINHRVLETKVVSIGELQPNDYNPNKMPDTEMGLLRQSISKFGFYFRL